MKKWLSVLLALLLICLPAGTAFADLYDEYGPYWEWTDEQWAESESWTDAQWEEYNAGEDAAELAEELAYYARQREALGCPYPQGVNVKLDGAWLSFGPSAPQLIDNEPMLPLRALAETWQAGLEYEHTSKTATLTLKDGSVLVFTLGNSTLQFTPAGGKAQQAYLWAAPTLVEGKMYIPTDALCEGLGYQSYWDSNLQICYLFKADALVEEINGRFTIANRLLLPSLSSAQTAPQLRRGSITLAGTLYTETGSDTISGTVHYESLSQGNIAEIKLSLKLDLAAMADSVLQIFDDEAWEIIGQIQAGTAHLIYDLGADTLYLQSNLLPLLDEKLDDKTWLKIEGLTDFSYESAWPVAGEAWSLGQIALALAEDNAGSYYGNPDIYAGAMGTAAELALFLGDDGFKVQNRGSSTSYTLKLNTKDLQKAIATDAEGLLSSLEATLTPVDLLQSLFGYGYYDTYDYEDYEEANSAPKQEALAKLDLQYALELREKDQELSQLDLNLVMQHKTSLPYTVSLQLHSTPQENQLSLVLAGRYFGKVALQLDETVSAATTEPLSAPPAGSTITDFLNLYLDDPPADWEDSVPEAPTEPPVEPTTELPVESSGLSTR